MRNLTYGRELKHDGEKLWPDLLHDLMTRKDLSKLSAVIIRPHKDFEIVNGKIDPKKKLNVYTHIVSPGTSHEADVNVVRITHLNQPKKMTYRALKSKSEVKFRNPTPLRLMEAILHGEITEYNYAVNNLDQDFVNNIIFKKMLDVREYNGVLGDYYDPKEVTRFPRRFQGTLVPSVYVGLMLSAFPLHIEDCSWPSVNVSLDGFKLWIVLADRADTRRLFDFLNSVCGDNCSAPENRKIYFPSIKVLTNAGFKFHYFIQRRGDTVVTFPGGAHFGFNLKESINVAKNVAILPDWLSVAAHMRLCDPLSDFCKSPGHQSLTDVGVKRMVAHYTNKNKEDLPLRFGAYTDLEKQVLPKEQESGNSRKRKRVRYVKKDAFFNCKVCNHPFRQISKLQDHYKAIDLAGCFNLNNEEFTLKV